MYRQTLWITDEKFHSAEKPGKNTLKVLARSMPKMLDFQEMIPFSSVALIFPCQLAKMAQVCGFHCRVQSSRARRRMRTPMVRPSTQCRHSIWNPLRMTTTSITMEGDELLANSPRRNRISTKRKEIFTRNSSTDCLNNLEINELWKKSYVKLEFRKL